MSKKTNTLLFILGGTVFNVLVTLIALVVLMVIYGRFLMPYLPENANEWILVVVFVLSIAVSFVVYRQVIKVITKKIDMDKYFDPIFGRRPPPRNQ